MLISVIIPTCHRNDLLAECLNRLAPGEQAGVNLADLHSIHSDDRFLAETERVHGVDPTTDKFMYEVIVTDDGVRATAQDLMHRRYPWARWIAGPRKGPAANRNNGAKHARGEWLAFVDDDCLPDSHWIETVARAVESDDLDVVEGKTICPNKRDTPFEEHVENTMGNAFWSCNLAVRRAIFAEMGGFDTDFLEAGGEDMEFAWRIRHRGLRSRFVDDWIVIHPARRIGWKKFWWRTWMIRWMALYRLKTGQAPDRNAGAYRATIDLTISRIEDLLRTTWHFFTEFDRIFWRRQLFAVIWKWLTFPVVLPYLALWNLRFRRAEMRRTSQM